MVIDENDDYSTYMITTDETKGKKQTIMTVILILLIFILIGLIIIAKNSFSIIR